MTTVFGGVPLQLRARLRRESLVRPVALLSREPAAGSAGAGGAGAGAGAMAVRVPAPVAVGGSNGGAAAVHVAR